MEKRYQIFISSTYDDLKKERDAVIRVCLNMGHIPVGMEMFSAGDEQQWEIIRRTIDDSDYYVVIVGHRYGSAIDHQSYTEREYDYALEVGVPVIGCVIDESIALPGNLSEYELRNRAKWLDFKDKVKKKQVAFWKNPDELENKVMGALVKITTARPREGWVRASTLPSAKVAEELSRLSHENAQLRQQLILVDETNRERRQAKISIDRITQINIGKVKCRKTIEYYVEEITGREKPVFEDSEVESSWTGREMFLAIAPSISLGAEKRGINAKLKNAIKKEMGLDDRNDDVEIDHDAIDQILQECILQDLINVQLSVVKVENPRNVMPPSQVLDIRRYFVSEKGKLAYSILIEKSATSNI